MKKKKKDTEIAELKNTISQIKNRIPEKTLGVINISLEMAEGKIREPEEKSTKITKLKREKKKKLEKK